MDDDTEILDWGNEDEERNVGSGEQRSFAAEEDAVSLGGDEEDDFLAHQSRVPQGTNRGQTPSRSTESARKRSGSESFPSDTSPRRQQQEKESDMSAPDQSAALPRPVTHALPPKPTVTTMSFVHPSHPSIIEATAMASQSDRNKRNGGGSKARSHDNIDALPQEWEIKLSRSTGEVYYYNPRTEESTWTRPGTASFRDAQNYHSEEPLDRGFLNRNGDIPSRTGLSDSDSMSYNDRHYRPGEHTRRDDRSGQTYSAGDSYQVSNRQNGRSSPFAARGRDSERVPRRHHSPTSDRDGVQSAHRDASATPTLSAEDRVWIARDVIVEPRQRERESRQHDPGTASSDHDRRHSEDTDKLSTLRPSSPIIYTRDRDSGTPPRLSSKSTQLASDSSAPRHKSRFSQPAVQRPEQRQPDNRHGIVRSYDNKSISHRTPDSNTQDRPPPAGPRSLSHAQADSTTAPGAEAQRSHKRSPLPPQSATYRGGSRQAPELDNSLPSRRSTTELTGEPVHERDAKVSSGDGNMAPITRHTSQCTPTHGYSSLRSTRDGSSDRAEPDRSGNSRWGKPRGQMINSYLPNESSMSQERDPDSMVVDTTTRPADLPRYTPRRPLDDDEHGIHPPRHPRSVREPTELNHPKVLQSERSYNDLSVMRCHDDVHRSTPIKDKQPEERYGLAPPSLSRRDFVRSQSATRIPPAAPGVRLSGTNNIPIGARNKHPNNAPAMSPRSRSGGPIISGSNAEPVGNRARAANRDGPPPADAPDSRNSESTHLRKSPIVSHPPLPPIEASTAPAAAPSSRVTKSRFGPPIVKETPERPHQRASMESLRSVGLPAEDNSRVTPPPLSRESSMVSAAHLGGSPPDPLPRRFDNFDASSQGSSSHRVDDNVRSRDAPHPSVVRGRPFPPRIPELRNETGSHLNDSRDVPSSPVHRRRTVDTYSARRLYDTRRDHYLAQPPPTAEDPVHSSNRTEKGPQMHPERAMLLQHVLPPRPQVEPLSHPGRPPRRDKGDGHAESARGDRLRLSTSPQSDRHRSEVDHPSAPRGGSLLDRLTVGGGDRSFYERVQVPTKRDRGEMISGDSALDNDGDGPDGQKRARRRGTKFRKSKFT